MIMLFPYPIYILKSLSVLGVFSLFLSVLSTTGQTTENTQSAQKHSPLEILDILDYLSYAQALEKKCSYLDKEDQAKLYLSDRWAKSITYRNRFPAQILLTATRKKAAHLKATETLSCDTEEMAGLFDQMRDYIRETVLKVRLEDIQ